MRTFLHLLSILLVLPVVGLACAFVVLGRAIATQSLLGAIFRLLLDVLWIIPWGVLSAASILLVLVVGGLFARTRWLAAACVALLGIVSTAIVLGLTIAHQNASLSQLPALVPGLAGVCIGAWIALRERPGKAPALSIA